jgi:hypothetical protein
LADLVERKVGLVAEQVTRFVVAFGGNGRGVAAGLGTRTQRTRLFAQVEVTHHTVVGDGKAFRDLGEGTLVLVHGLDNTPTQFHRIRTHGRFLRLDKDDRVTYSDCRISKGIWKPL